MLGEFLAAEHLVERNFDWARLVEVEHSFAELVARNPVAELVAELVADSLHTLLVELADRNFVAVLVADKFEQAVGIAVAVVVELEQVADLV